jgi:hypothetical protein
VLVNVEDTHGGSGEDLLDGRAKRCVNNGADCGAGTTASPRAPLTASAAHRSRAMRCVAPSSPRQLPLPGRRRPRSRRARGPATRRELPVILGERLPESARCWAAMRAKERRRLLVPTAHDRSGRTLRRQPPGTGSGASTVASAAVDELRPAALLRLEPDLKDAEVTRRGRRARGAVGCRRAYGPGFLWRRRPAC